MLVIWSLVIVVTDLFLWARTIDRVDIAALVGFFQGNLSLGRVCSDIVVKFLSWEYYVLSAYYLGSICRLWFLLWTAFYWFLNDVALFLTLASLIVKRRVIVIVTSSSTILIDHQTLLHLASHRRVIRITFRIYELLCLFFLLASLPRTHKTRTWRLIVHCGRFFDSRASLLILLLYLCLQKVGLKVSIAIVSFIDSGDVQLIYGSPFNCLSSRGSLYSIARACLQTLHPIARLKTFPLIMTAVIFVVFFRFLLCCQ